MMIVEGFAPLAEIKVEIPGAYNAVATSGIPRFSISSTPEQTYALAYSIDCSESTARPLTPSRCPPSAFA
jgi:hypothetical protein